MSHADLRLSETDFLDWQDRQDEYYELVGGVPVGMVGARRVHDAIVMNGARELGTQLRGLRCRPFSEAVAIRIPNGNIRRPDLAVDCGRFVPDATCADQPCLAIEVLSDFTRAFDLTQRLEEYKTVSTLTAIMLVATDMPRILLWQRDADTGWRSGLLAGLEAEIVLPAIGVTLKLSDLYEGLTFPPALRLVRDAG